MASAVGRLIAIDKETQDKTRPSTARVKMIPDLMEKLPKMMCLQYWTSRPKDPSLATIEDFDQANKVQQFEENLDQIFESSGTCDHDFTMKDNDDEVGLKYQAKDFLPVAPNYVN
uniref:Uncharacterized protein n=1 Tax=Solanum tuberosum TaxID=4113 RepID=M1DMC9_SOLTU